MSYKEAVDGVCIPTQDEEGRDFSDYSYFNRGNLILVFTDSTFKKALCFNKQLLYKNDKLIKGEFHYVHLPNTNYILIEPGYSYGMDGTSFALKKLKYEKDYSQDDFNSRNWSRDFMGTWADGSPILPEKLYDRAKAEKYFPEDKENLYYLERLWEDEHPELKIFGDVPEYDSKEVLEWRKARAERKEPKIEDKNLNRELSNIKKDIDFILRYLEVMELKNRI